MNDFFDKLGAAARRAADTVSTEVSIAAEEQKVRQAYQALGKLYYKASREGGELSGLEFADQCRKIDASLKRIEELKESKKVTVEPTPEKTGDAIADETDFVVVEE